MILPNKVYELLKWLCLIVSPAFCTLLVTLSNLWGWQIPTEAIVGTITAITTFVGVIIGISNHNYNKELSDEYKNN